MKVSSKLTLFILVVSAGIAYIFLSTSSQERGSYFSYGQGLLAFKSSNYPKATQYFSNSYAKDPNNLMALYFQALSKVKTAEMSKNPQIDSTLFRETLLDTKDLIKKGTDKRSETLYLFYYVKALAHLDLNEFESATEAIEKSRALAPDDYDVLVLAGRVKIGRKDYPTAVIYLDQARELRHFKAYEAYFYLGEAHEALKDYSKAWYDYGQCVKSWPTSELKKEAIRRKTGLPNK